MHWYNPKTGEVEWVKAPSTDEEALGMFSGRPDSGRFVERYVVLREEGLSVEQALVFVGHSLSMCITVHKDSCSDVPCRPG